RRPGRRKAISWLPTAGGLLTLAHNSGRPARHRVCPTTKESLMSGRASRRDFLKAGALTGVGFWIGGDAGADQPAPPPGAHDRLNVAVIGAGGRGGDNLRAVARTENIVALCDVDERRAANAYRDFPRAARHHDFRRMLDRERSIDAVVVSTPDHNHA